jgi:hypothetical protein
MPLTMYPIDKSMWRISSATILSSSTISIFSFDNRNTPQARVTFRVNGKLRYLL